jgi:cytochrome P450
MTDAITPALQRDAASFLNKIVLELLGRSTIPPTDRAPYLGKLFVVERAVDIERVFNDPQGFEKDFALVSAVGPSRFNMNGPEWVSLRAKTQRHYAQAGKPSFAKVYQGFYAEELDQIATLDHQGLETAISRAALRCFFFALGVNADVEAYLVHFQDLRAMAELLQYRSWLSGAQTTELEAMAQELTRIRRGLWQTCRENLDVMALLERFSTRGDPFPMETIFSDFLTNMFAGIETTTSSLMWMIDCLGRGVPVQMALLAALDDGNDSQIDGFRDETMRLFSPIPFVVRKVTRPTQFGATHLRAGDSILLSLVAMHRDPEFWSTPHEFHAARPEFRRKNGSDTTAFRPFLSGPRACGGRRIAEMEINVALRLILDKFELINEQQDVPSGFRYSLAFRPILTNQLTVKRRLNRSKTSV